MKLPLIILAVSCDGELDILVYSSMQAALDHMAVEIEVLTGELPKFKTEGEVWEIINEEGIPLNFKIREVFA